MISDQDQDKHSKSAKQDEADEQQDKAQPISQETADQEITEQDADQETSGYDSHSADDYYDDDYDIDFDNFQDSINRSDEPAQTIESETDQTSDTHDDHIADDAIDESESHANVSEATSDEVSDPPQSTYWQGHDSSVESEMTGATTNEAHHSTIAYDTYEAPATPDIDSGELADLSVGALLATVRKQKGYSTDETTARLRLSEQQLMYLENDQFDYLGVPVFVRGYIRNYAQMLGLPVESVLARYNRQSPNDYVVMGQSRAREQEVNRFPIEKLIMLALIAGVAYYAYAFLPWQQWFGDADITPTQSDIATNDNAPAVGLTQTSTSSIDDQPDDESARTSSERAEDAQMAVGVDAVQIENITPSGEDVTLVETPEPEEDLENSPAITQSNTGSSSLDADPATAGLTIINPDASVDNQAVARQFVIRASQDCWTEATASDSDERYVYETIPGGSEREFSAAGAVSFRFGNPNAISISINGNPIDLSEYLSPGSGVTSFEL